MPEQDPNQLRIGALMERAGKAIERKAAIATIGLTGLFGAGVAWAVQGNTEQASASEVTTSNAVDGELGQECTETKLITPQNIKANMVHPGRDQGRTQDTLLSAEFVGMSDLCDEDFLRKSDFRSQVRERGRWVSLKTWSGLYMDNEAGVGKGQESNGPLVKCPNPKVRVVVRSRILLDKPKRVPIKGEPGLYTIQRPVLKQKFVRKPVQVPC